MGELDVSVLLPFYDSRSTLLQAVESVLSNDDEVNFELILIDDGSTDYPEPVLELFWDDARVTVVRQENRGLAHALNRGLKEARGRYIARMDADDVSVAGRLGKQLQYLDQTPAAVLVGGQITRVVNETVVDTSNFPTEHAEILNGLLAGRHVMCHPAVMFRKDVVATLGGYWSHGVAEDWDLFLRLAEVGELSNLPDTVLNYRYHAGSINSRSMIAVRTNIALAIENHRRRLSGDVELNPEEFRTVSTRWRKIVIRFESASLAVYRRALSQRSARETASRLKSALLLLVAALLYPPFAIRRVARAVRVRAAGSWSSRVNSFSRK